MSDTFQNRKKLRLFVLIVVIVGLLIWLYNDETRSAWLRRLTKNLIRELIQAF